MNRILLLVTIILMTFDSIGQCLPNVTDSLVARWDLNANAADSSGNNHNGTVVGSLIFTTDRCLYTSASCSSFATNRYINVPDAADLRLNNTDFSIACWIFMKDTMANQNNRQAILTKRTTSGVGQNGYNVSVSASQKQFDFIVSGGGDPWISAKCPIVLNRWQHFVVTYSKSNYEAKIYLDAQMTSDTIGLPSPNPTNAILRIGQDGATTSQGNYPFHGSLDDIRIYNRTLNSCDIDSLFRMKCFTSPTTPCSSITLPILLLSFKAMCENNKIKILWSTASEINNEYFEIERSGDGITFQLIGLNVKGAKNSTTIHYYSGFDDHPLNGISYYRLKQIDFDGEFSYSYISAVSCNQGIQFSIYPNPATNKLFLFGQNKDICNLKIYTIDGKVIQVIYSLEEKDEIDISNLAPGIYYLVANTLSDFKGLRFIKN